MTQKSAVYALGHDETVLRSHKWRTATNSAGYLLPSLLPHMNILDIGCGPGTITVDLATLVPEGYVTGLDSEGEVLEQARQIARERGVKNVKFLMGNVYALDFPDDTFDVVHAHQVLQHVGDPIGALREMRRVTKPGGIVAARENDFSCMTLYPEAEGLKIWKDLYMKVARASGGEPNAGRQLHAWAKQAGFDWDDITCSASTWCYNTPAERAWWSGSLGGRLLSPKFSRTAVEGGHATMDLLKHCVEAWHDWSMKEDGWFASLHGEILCHVPIETYES